MPPPRRTPRPHAATNVAERNHVVRQAVRARAGRLGYGRAHDHTGAGDGREGIDGFFFGVRIRRRCADETYVANDRR
jgi:hypothetical protein